MHGGAWGNVARLPEAATSASEADQSTEHRSAVGHDPEARRLRRRVGPDRAECGVLPTELGRLSRAELSIAEGVLRGATNCEIALERGSSARTVAHQIAAVYRKLGVSSRGELAARLLAGPQHAVSMDHVLRSLTLREREVVAYAALGHSNKVIAYELGLAESAVAMRLSRAAKKLGVRRRVELIRAVAESGEASVRRAGSAPDGSASR